MAAGGPQMLATSNVCGVDAAVLRALWCFVLQTSEKIECETGISSGNDQDK